jgi:hypothetical protein
MRTAHLTTPLSFPLLSLLAQLETPCFVPLVNNSLFEIRLYGVGSQQAFSSALVNDPDFATAQGKGFEDNFAFISGATTANRKIPMPAPVMARPANDATAWDIGFFVPASLYPTVASMPTPSNPAVSIAPLGLQAFAVVVFGGFATQNDFVNNAGALRGYLTEANVTAITNSPWSECWLQYDAPDQLFNRHNEVWIAVGSTPPA